uniref:Calmodulin regulated spectrin-associated protein 1a n=1 Tax=Anabas testudineus TaxID=64144 RepID=A0A7N6B9X9_ANATE
MYTEATVEQILLGMQSLLTHISVIHVHHILVNCTCSITDHIPEDLRDPFYTDQYDQEHIKPPVIRLLLSCELYCRVCTLILKTEQAASLQSHLSVIQALSRKGIYVVESDDTPVTEEDLACVPIKMSAHMPMIDALMMAYTVEMISIEKVVASVKRFSTFSASKELPFDLEDAMVFWINKVNMKMREITEREHKVKHHPLESPSHQKVRYRREHASGRQLPFFPPLENLMRDVCDGAALLAVVHYYCPDLMKLEDICLKEVPSIADSLYNIQLLREFANEYLNKSFYLTTEDMLYSPLVLKHNVMVFIAELFWWFETVKPEFVQPRDLQEFKDGNARPSVPISNATKRSFLASPGVGDNHSSPEVCNRYFLHPEDSDPFQGLDAELEDLNEEEEDLDEAVTTKDPNWSRKTFNEEDEEEESAKLQEDMNVKEHEDKDLNGGSGRSSPCLSGHSQASSMASGSVRMTSFAERRAQQQRFGSNHDLRSSASSSQRTTPDGSESSGPLTSSWRLKRDQSPSSPLGGCTCTGESSGGANVLASEIVQLRMQLEEKRRAIEHQKKKMEVLSARQRQKLGKAAFLHIVKKGGGKSDTLPNPLKADTSKDELNKEKGPSSKDDMCVDSLRGAKEGEGTTPPGALEGDKKGNNGSFYLEEELDLNECSRSIELLNEAIGSIQQQMMQLSLQQEMLMKQNVKSSPGATPPPPLTNDKNLDSKASTSFHYMEHISGTGTAPTRKPPKLSSGRSSRSKPSELKVAKEQSRQTSRTLTPTQSGSETLPHLRQLAGGRSPRTEQPDSPRNPTAGETIDRPGSGHVRSATFRLHDEANMRLPTRVDLSAVAAPEVSFDECLSSTLRESELNSSDGSGKENIPSEEVQRSKTHLIEVDLSDLKAPEEEEGAEDKTTEGGDGEQKSVMGFFFKDEQKAEDELAKKRAAFLLKQQKKAEEARLRKQQLEAESELKRDEARRKAEEDRLRKEEEKTRREIIKQEYLRRKQQEMFEEQGLVKPKTPKPKQKHRPKSVFREESSIFVSISVHKNVILVQPGPPVIMSSSCDSVESFPGSRNTSRTAERDWDNGSTASSITSMAEYTGPKLFKEPSAKSNKPIIHNAISHCCLAGKVNEPQKNQILEELEKCESNHLMILFRDGGCQFRALYSYFPDTEEIQKLTGTGPKSISKKMIDKLYKYSSDRKQFTVIPAKTVSVSVDALTIHNHLWQAKRSAVPKKSGK